MSNKMTLGDIRADADRLERALQETIQDTVERLGLPLDQMSFNGCLDAAHLVAREWARANGAPTLWRRLGRVRWQSLGHGGWERDAPSSTLRISLVGGTGDIDWFLDPAPRYDGVLVRVHGAGKEILQCDGWHPCLRCLSGQLLHLGEDRGERIDYFWIEQ